MQTIYLAGDSTVRNYDESQFPQAGWGQFLEKYLVDAVEVKNMAVGGLSSKTFITEGYLEEIELEIKENHYLFIQFGHNDSTIERPERYTEPYGDYITYLKKYIDVAERKKAIPILVTPVCRLNYHQGVFQADFLDYCQAMKELAKKNDVLLIDLMRLSMKHLTEIGYSKAKELYMISVNGFDCTHFTEKGASIMAQLVCREMETMEENLAELVKHNH